MCAVLFVKFACLERRTRQSRCRNRPRYRYRYRSGSRRGDSHVRGPTRHRRCARARSPYPAHHPVELLLGVCLQRRIDSSCCRRLVPGRGTPEPDARGCGDERIEYLRGNKLVAPAWLPGPLTTRSPGTAIHRKKCICQTEEAWLDDRGVEIWYGLSLTEFDNAIAM